MKPMIAAVALALAVGLLGFTYVDSQHVDQRLEIGQARDHANTAVGYGQQGHSLELVQHAKTALEHVNLARREKAIGDLDAATRSLEQSIKAGNEGKAGKATEEAKAALEYLDAARAGMGG